MNKINLKTNDVNFEALLFSSSNPIRKVLFAAGSGGNPERHLPMLNALAENNCTVIAPYFERIASPVPNAEQILARRDLLIAALDSVQDLNIPTVGVGHSLGAAVLLALAGGKMWTRSGEGLPIAKDQHLKRLILFAPPTGFFQGPHALDAVEAPTQVWVGSLDTITPIAQMEVLKSGFPTGNPLDLRVIEGAGHFTFMNTLPPHITDNMKDREVFLSRLATEICLFATA